MPVGTNFDTATIPGLSNGVDEKMLISTSFESASNEDGYFLTLVKYYQIYSSDFIPLSLYQPRRGQYHRITLESGTDGDDNPFDLNIYYIIESVKLDRIGSPRIFNDKSIITVKVTIHLCPLTNSFQESPSNPLLPWQLPPYDFKLGTILTHHNASTFYRTGIASPSVQALLNTAGAPLNVSTTRPLVKMSFSFNLPLFNYLLIYNRIGYVNNDVVTICGITIDPFMVKLQSVNSESCYQDYVFIEDGVETSRTIHYYKISVVLILDPLSYLRYFHNVGTHFKKDNGIQKIWYGYINNQLVYNTLDYLKNNGCSSPQELMTNLFLNDAGTDLSPLDQNTGGQIPVYLPGIVEPLCPFQSLFGSEPGPQPGTVINYGLPSSPPYSWH